MRETQHRWIQDHRPDLTGLEFLDRLTRLEAIAGRKLASLKAELRAERDPMRAVFLMLAVNRAAVTLNDTRELMDDLGSAFDPIPAKQQN